MGDFGDNTLELRQMSYATRGLDPHMSEKGIVR